MHFGLGEYGMILFWVVLVAAVVLLVKVFSDMSGKSDNDAPSPLKVLKTRYSAGEITRGEFEEIKHDLVER